MYLGGLVVVKENTAPPKKCREGRGNYMLDAENAAVLRTHAHHMALFRRAGYRVVKSTRQADSRATSTPCACSCSRHE